MSRLHVADLKAVLSFLEEAQAVDGPAPLTRELLDRFAELIRCETAAFFEADHRRRIIRERITGSATKVVPWNDEHWLSGRTAGLQRYKLASGPGPVVLSDLFSRQLRSRPDFNPNFRAGGWIDEIHVDLDPPRRWKAHLTVYGSRDFGDRERLILELVRPHLAALYRTAGLRRRLAAATAALRPDAIVELTRREREVMLCVADGLSNEQIASALWIERSTVRKHLEHVYEKLGVRTRTAALAKLRR